MMRNTNPEELLLTGGREAPLWRRAWGERARLTHVLFLQLDVGYTGDHYTITRPFCVSEIFCTILRKESSNLSQHPQLP